MNFSGSVISVVIIWSIIIITMTDIADIVSFLQGFNPIDILEKVEKLEPNGLTDINLDRFISFPFNPKQNDIRKLAKETDKILEEVLYGSLVASAEALIGLLENCKQGSEDLYKVPDIAEFRQASSNGDEIYKITSSNK